MPITRFRVFSDQHLEFRDWIAPPAEAEAILVARDVAVGIRGIVELGKT